MKISDIKVGETYYWVVTGTWSDFDEFEPMDIEICKVVAIKILKKCVHIKYDDNGEVRGSVNPKQLYSLSQYKKVKDKILKQQAKDIKRIREGCKEMEKECRDFYKKEIITL